MTNKEMTKNDYALVNFEDFKCNFSSFTQK